MCLGWEMLHQPKKMHAGSEKNCWEWLFLQAKFIQIWIWKEEKVSLLSTMVKYAVTMSPLRINLPLSNTVTNMQIVPSPYP